MANQTIVNVFSKLKTVINNGCDNIPKFTNGSVIDNKYQVIDKISGISGEADLYKVCELGKPSPELVLKLYRRKNSVKEQVVASLKQINNPNIATIINEGNIDGYSYIVMPFYSYGNLGTLVEQGIRFSVDDLKTLIIPSVINGLKAIHEKGIIHKDIKPSNLMVSNDQNNIVLIDFGISSATEGNTVVVTQTGKSPFYSAPETSTGIFLAESDYYSLGITLYELVTGYTPYQNINVENVARYAQIQKIPYPEGFDQNLADLIDGLTYKDISNRNDKSNPNRRWCFTEVEKWLKGEKQVKPGSNANQTSSGSMNNIPYMFKGSKIFDNKSIISSLMENWDDGKKEVFRGLLARHYELTENAKALEECKKAEELLSENFNNKAENIIFFDLMYKLEPSITEFYWKGFKFDDLQDYGNALIDNVLHAKINECLLKSASELLENGILLKYVSSHKNSVDQNYLQLIENNKKLLKVAPLPHNQQALRLGYALTGREDFRIGGKIFNSIQEWNTFLDNLYNEDIIRFVSFNRNNKEEIELQKKLFAGDLLKSFISKLLDETKVIILAGGKYCFRNTKEFKLFIDKLWTDKKFLEFAVFKEQCSEELSKLEETLPASELENFKSFHEKSESVIYFTDLAFPNVQSFIDYVLNLQKLYKPLGTRFLKTHYKGIQFALRSQSKNNIQLIQDKLGINFSIFSNIAVGKYVKFGNYWQNSKDNKEPIEWLVLDVIKDNKALLISRYGLDCKQYHTTWDNITWEQCDLRKWLNSEFINNAFSREEQEQIKLSEIVNNANPSHGTTGGNNTVDKIFLLSIEEVNKYFHSDKERECKATKYAIENDAYANNNGNCDWWLRSPGGYQDDAAYVNNVGVVGALGYIVYYGDFSLRVALWVNL